MRKRGEMRECDELLGDDLIAEWLMLCHARWLGALMIANSCCPEAHECTYREIADYWLDQASVFCAC